MQKIKAKKHLGQHFLNDNSVASRIADTIDSHKEYPIIEIGPGMGVLTEFLLNKSSNLKLVELDEESILYLKNRYPDFKNNIIHEDFLKINIDSIRNDNDRICIVGNYPYNISSQIFFKILDWRDYVVCASGMLQKEVAERLSSPPGNKNYGILSVLLQAWYNIEYLFSVPPDVFTPRPKVNSGVIKMIRNDRLKLDCSEDHFKRIVKTAFNQRRKTLRNSLRPLFGKDFKYYSLAIFDKRPEQLYVEDFVELTKMEESLMSF